MNSTQWKEKLARGEYAEKLAYVYACGQERTAAYADRICDVLDGFSENFGESGEIRIFSAPGRTEIGGNHTDHQGGAVLAASLNLDVIGAAAKNGTDKVRILSKGYAMDELDINELDSREEEYDRAISLIRGILRKFSDMGYKLEGFDAYTISSVLKGSGMSSSAAFEVLVGTIVNGLFANGAVSAVEIAKIGKFAENVYYNKPSGLLDQMASSVGNIVAIDFFSEEKPVVERVDFDFTKSGYALCIIDSGADHADLTGEYAAVPAEMRAVAEFFGKKILSEIDENEFYNNIAALRKSLANDRAVLRAYHYLNETKRAKAEAAALKSGDFDGFLKLITESGHSSYMYLQNIYAQGQPENQAVAIALAMCEHLLAGRGAYRVHGGGFAGTVQAFVPVDMLAQFKSKIDAALGEGMCHILAIRPVGGIEF